MEDALSNAAPTEADIVDLVVVLLAELDGTPAEEHRATLEDTGRDLPVDSLFIVEILTRVEDQYAIRLPADAQSATATRSVRSFARTVLEAVRERNQP